MSMRAPGSISAVCRGSRARAFHAQFVCQVSQPLHLVLEGLACFVEIEQTFRAQFECVAGRLRQFNEQLAARQAEIAQHGRDTARVLGGAIPRKQPAPAHELGIKSRLNVKRAPRTRHPFQSLPDHPRRGDRRDMTRRDVAGAPMRTRIGALGVALNHRDRKPLPGEIVRGTKADDPGAANDHAPRIAHLDEAIVQLMSEGEPSDKRASTGGVAVNREWGEGREQGTK